MLSRFFMVDQHRLRSGSETATPVLTELDVAEDVGPLLATNMRGEFVQTRRSRGGVARCAFFECPVAKEAEVLVALHAALIEGGVRVPTLEAGFARVKGARFVLAEEEGVKLPDGVQRFPFSFPTGSALVLSAPDQCGFYIRSGGYLALLVTRYDRALAAVSP